MNRTKPLPRVYLPGEVAAHGVAALPQEQAHHLAHVLRLAPGEAVVAFDGHGHEYDATIERIAKSGVTLQLGAPRAVDRESPLDVTLAQGLSSADRMDYTIQKAVELGVSAIQPLATQRSVVRLDAERGTRRVAHWQAVVVSACEQCGRNRVPAVLPIAPVDAWLGRLTSDTLRLALTPGATTSLTALARPAQPIVLLVGPEGGLSPREHEDASASGFTHVRLGPRILRTETAAVAALAAMQAIWGDF